MFSITHTQTLTDYVLMPGRYVDSILTGIAQTATPELPTQVHVLRNLEKFDKTKYTLISVVLAFSPSHYINVPGFF